jgi:hypothetical protein
MDPTSYHILQVWGWRAGLKVPAVMAWSAKRGTCMGQQLLPSWGACAQHRAEGIHPGIPGWGAVRQKSALQSLEPLPAVLMH